MLDDIEIAKNTKNLQKITKRELENIIQRVSGIIQQANCNLRCLQYLQEHLSEQRSVTVTYFKPDEKKAGGAYETVTGVVKKVDAYAGKLVFADGRRIGLERIIELV